MLAYYACIMYVHVIPTTYNYMYVHEARVTLQFGHCLSMLDAFFWFEMKFIDLNNNF